LASANKRQQAALTQTGQASFVTGLSYNSTTGASITTQEKQDLYGKGISSIAE
jgi:filamentous hemagglutinin